MKISNNNLIALLIAFWGIPNLCQATLDQLPATPDILSEPTAGILITEVNFKNKDKDYVILTYTSPTGKPVNLKDLSIKDDGVIKKIETDFFVASGQQILLTFETDQPDNAPYLYTKKTGLTATTEQLILLDRDNSIIDMVCWVNDSPTASELSDFAKAYENEGWIDNDIYSCLPSDTIATNESIKRISPNDTDSSIDWILPPTQTAPTQTTETTPISPITIPQTTPITQTPLATITIPQATPNPELVIINTPVAKTSTSTASSNTSTKTTSQYSNGNLSTEIVISEILPNPEGTDSGKEWIELTNTGSSTINLGNWILDDDEGGSKPYTLPDNLTIKSNQSLLIDGSKCKLSLGNSEDTVRLFDFNEELISEVQYESAPSAESYSLISIIDDNEDEISEYMWTANQTPGSANPTYNKFRITIEQEPLFDTTYFFMASKTDGTTIKIIFDETIIAAPLAKATFTKNTTLEVIVNNSDDNYELLEYEIIGTTTINSSPSNFLLPLFIGFLLISGIIVFVLYKKISWQTNINPI